MRTKNDTPQGFPQTIEPDYQRFTAPCNVAYWEENAPWYGLWLHHNRYHERILRNLEGFAQPAWKILDIGGGTGVLSLPLVAKGCNVTMLEPSRAMLRFLDGGPNHKNLESITVDPRRWEDVGPKEYNNYDLIIASNSLHLTTLGLSSAFDQVLIRQPRHVLLVSERFPHETPRWTACFPYRVGFRESFETESSFVYHSMDEALQHLRFRDRWFGNGSSPSDALGDLVRSGGHLIHREYARVHLFRFDREKGLSDDHLTKEHEA